MSIAGRFRRFLSEEDWHFAPQEMPVIPGSPGSPAHPMPRRIAYAAVGTLVGLTSGFGNALVSANTTTLAGSLALDPVDIAWLPTVYVMTNVSANLLLIKFRQQFGLRPFAVIFIGIYALLAFAHLFVSGFWSAVVVRAASGMAGAPLSSLCLYYLMQSFPPTARLRAVVIGIGIPQLATPLARLFSPELLAMNQWHTLYLFELGLAAISLAGVLAHRLPPTVRVKTFEPLDFVTFVLFATSMAMIAAVLGLGRWVWWTDTAWIAWALAAAIPMLMAALVIESRRQNPLLNTRWLGSADIVRFAIVATMARIVLSEQTSGAVGLLTVLGLNNDELQLFFLLIFAATVAGMAVSAGTLNVEKLVHPVSLAIGIVAVAAFADSHSTSLTRPPQLYVTQILIAFSAALFLGPSLLFGITRVIKPGSGHLISFIALFGIVTSMGTLAGSAVIQTYQVIREKANSAVLVDQIVSTDPIVQQRLSAGAASLGGVIGDPALRSAEGASLLSQAARTQANVLGYDDTFRFIALLAALTFAYLVFGMVRQRIRARREADT